MASNGNFKGIDIGDHCNLTIRYMRDIEQKKIPRADGVILRNNGGGVQELTVTGWVIKSTRQDVEDYCANLATSFGNSAGTLVINDTTYTNCFFLNIDPSLDDQRWNYFTISFMRNPY